MKQLDAAQLSECTPFAGASGFSIDEIENLFSKHNLRQTPSNS
jgi:hypothetical protein